MIMEYMYQLLSCRACAVETMNSGNNTFEFNNFMQAAMQANDIQPRHQLSPYAPMFTPNIPPPPLNVQNGNFSQMNMPFQGDFYRNNPPPLMNVNPNVNTNEQFDQDYSYSEYNPSGNRTTDKPSAKMRGNQQFPANQGRGRGQGRRGRGYLRDHFGQRQPAHQQQQMQSYNNAYERQPMQQQRSRASARHARDDYGELLYSHVDMGNENERCDQKQGARPKFQTEHTMVEETKCM